MSLTAGDKVAEIFKFAGQAFIKLGELTSSFDKHEEDLSVDKWDEEDIETLKRTIRTFSEELNSLSENLKKKAISNMKQGMKRRVNASKGLTHVTSSPSKTPKVVKLSDA